MKFRKKPVEIEAMQLHLIEQQDVGAWLQREGVGYLHAVNEDDLWVGFSIPTLEGNMLASWGDWIIKGVQGEFYPCKPDIFEATYEPVEETFFEAGEIEFDNGQYDD